MDPLDSLREEYIEAQRLWLEKEHECSRLLDTYFPALIDPGLGLPVTPGPPITKAVLAKFRRLDAERSAAQQRYEAAETAYVKANLSNQQAS